MNGLLHSGGRTSSSRWTTIFALLAAILFVATPFDSYAAENGQLANEETIHHYDVDIRVQPDSKLHIVETIEVTALGDKIKRGIFREFPIYSYPILGMRQKHALKVISATRNREPEKFHVEEPNENHADFARIYLGDENQRLNKGKYVYTIEYVTDDWLHHGDQEDELYWNVTGNYWDFPIEHSSVTIHLPADVPADKLTINAWTGAAGAKEEAWREVDVDGGLIKLETTAPLPRREGWTISVKFPTGAITFPPESEIYAQMLSDNADIFFTLFAVLCALVVYTIGWIMVGRDPSPGAVMIQDVPPGDLSPAAARYIEKMGFDNTCLATALVYAASEGAIELKQDQLGNYSVQMISSEKLGELPEDIQSLVRGLVGSRGRITFTKLQHKRIAAALSDFKKTLAKNYRGSHFVTNFWWSVWGASVSVAGMVMAIVSTPNFALGLFFTVWLSFWTIGVFALGTAVLGAWKAVMFAPGGVIGRGIAMGGAIFITAFATPFFIAEIVVLGIFATQVSFFIPFGILLLVIMGWRFFHWMKRPTHEGRQVLDHLDGYRQWLEGEFVRQVSYAATPEEGATLFDQRLPWAMALGMANGWYKELGARVLDASKFNSSLGSNNSSRLFGPSGTTAGGFFTGAALAGALGGAVSASSVSPSKGGGSSSSGGGSSGGGGGGGGGGGW